MFAVCLVRCARACDVTAHVFDHPRMCSTSDPIHTDQHNIIMLSQHDVMVHVYGDVYGKLREGSREGTASV